MTKLFSERGRAEIEICIAWAAQHDYNGALAAAAAFGTVTGRVMYLDQPYYNSYVWRDAGPSPFPTAVV
jgi:hypothetical protein